MSNDDGFTAEAAAETPQVNRIPFDAPWEWLSEGWTDMWREPGISLTYGAVFTVVSLVIFIGFYLLGGASLVLPMAGGFLLIGPLMAVGLYETSRRLQEGEPVTFADIVTTGMQSPGQLAFMGALLMIVYFAWLEIALLLFMLFLGPQSLQLESIMPTLLFTWEGLGLLIVGTAVGAVLAMVVFSVTAVSIPLLMRRKIDVVTASLTSVQAVAKNPAPMALWAVLIAGMMGISFATLAFGLVIFFPLVGHATWHAYRALIPPLKPATVSGRGGRRPRAPAKRRPQGRQTGRSAAPKGKRQAQGPQGKARRESAR